jgi:hypothetical protein
MMTERKPTEGTSPRVCLVEDCEKPVEGQSMLGMVCAEHQKALQAEWNADAWAVAAEEILPVFAQLAHLFGNATVHEIMDDALEKAKREAEFWKAEDERLHIREQLEGGQLKALMRRSDALTYACVAVEDCGAPMRRSGPRPWHTSSRCATRLMTRWSAIRKCTA